MNYPIVQPWTPDQVKALNEFQHGNMHPFTCETAHPQGRILVATTHGWICPYCDYTQNWAHDFMFSPVAPVIDPSARERDALMEECDRLRAVAQSRERSEGKMRAERDRLREVLNTPEVEDFARGVVTEAQHQRLRWGAGHDDGKSPMDWFWLIGYLAQKAATAQLAGNTEKAKHHCISTAAAMANWHAAITGEHTAMRPGIADPEPAALADKLGEV